MILYLQNCRFLARAYSLPWKEKKEITCPRSLFGCHLPRIDSGEPLRPWEKQGLGTQEGTSLADDRETQHTREWLESAAILLNSCFHYIVFTQRTNQKVMHLSLVGMVWKLLLVKPVIFKKSLLSGKGVRHKTSAIWLRVIDLHQNWSRTESAI